MTEERIISTLRKAWVTPEGIIHEFDAKAEHHVQWWSRNFPEDLRFDASSKLGWIRLTRRRRRAQ